MISDRMNRSGASIFLSVCRLADRDRQILQVKLNADKLETDVVEKEQTIDSLKQSCRDAEEREESLKYMQSSVHVRVYMHICILCYVCTY